VRSLIGGLERRQKQLRCSAPSWTTLEASEPNIPYFATSLPAMLLFEEDLRRRKTIEARYLRAQAMAGMGRTSEAADLLDELLTMDRNHAGAADLLRRLNPSGGKATGDSTRESRPLP
jgi:hypothetical protein